MKQFLHRMMKPKSTSNSSGSSISTISLGENKISKETDFVDNMLRACSLQYGYASEYNSSYDSEDLRR